MADVLGKVADGIGKAAHALGDAAQGTGQAAASAFHEVVSDAKATGSKVARDQVHGLAEATRHLVDGVRNGNATGGALDALGDVAKGQGHTLADVWDGASGMVEAGYKGVVHGSREAGGGLGRAYDAGVDGAARAVDDLAGPGAGKVVRGVANGVAQPVRDMAGVQFGVAQGVAEGAGSMVHGLGDLVVGGVRMSTDAQYRDKLVAKVGAAATGLAHGAAEAARHPRAALATAKHAAAGVVARVKASEQDAVRQGRGAEWAGHAVGRAGFEVASFLLPVAKAGEAANLAGKAGKAAEALADAGRAGDAGHAVADATEAGRASAPLHAMARKAGGAGEEATDASAHVPRPARDPARGAGQPKPDGLGRVRRLRIADRMTTAHGKLVGEAERQAAIKHMAQVLPAGVMERMEAKGLKVVVTDYSVTDHAADLHRRDFAGTYGLYRGDTKEIVIPTRALDPITGQGPRRLTHGAHDVASEHAGSTLLHEYGHAIDDLYDDAGRLSEQPAFLKSFSADGAAARRFCQRPDEPAEAFTEMFAHFTRNPARVRRETPTVYAYFSTLMGGKGPVTEAGVAARKASLAGVDNMARRMDAVAQRAHARIAGAGRSFNDLEAALNGAQFEKRYGPLSWVNPTGATDNGLARAQAVDRMIGGGTKIPARGNAPTTLKGIRNALAQSGTRLGPPTDYAGVEKAMLGAGEGSHAIVTGTVPGSTASRFWNVVVHDGTMLAVDAGPGREAVAKSLSTLDLPGMDTGSGGRWSGLHNFNECRNIRLGTIRTPGQP